jgi:NadR type nicotinamide-nucleotide adenylyltransferase
MEGRLEKTMNGGIKKIVVTGPESTGKSSLTRDLAQQYHTVFIPEYARTYIEKLDRPYCYNDLEQIAITQVNDLKLFQRKANGILFLDTYLIITKVWFEVVYDRCPQWISDRIGKKEIDLYLLCSTDLPWEPDEVRENGGVMRELLYKRYLEELEKYGLNYRIISGLGTKRLENAVQAINSFILP